jgi:hypothetical protein
VRQRTGTYQRSEPNMALIEDDEKATPFELR